MGTIVQITEGELLVRKVEREAERRLRPFACGVSDVNGNTRTSVFLRTYPFQIVVSI
jgi:hypothetical protein